LEEEKLKKVIVLIIVVLTVLVSSNALGATIISQIGDVDGFQEGDVVDVPYRSETLLSAPTGCGLEVFKDTDVMRDNWTIGLSHSFTIPQGQIIESATLTIGVYRWRGDRTGAIIMGDDIGNDLFTSTSKTLFFSDLLGFTDPPMNATTEYVIDLSQVPMKDYWSMDPYPVYNHNLLSELMVGEFNLWGAPDYGIDYSILEIHTIPEPATLSLLALGALAMLRRRK
jgi:hypothetical protein